MTAVPLGVSTFKRTMAQSPEILLCNMFVEKDPTQLVDGITRIQRAGLADLVRVDPGPVRGIYQQAGTFEGRYIVVSGSVLALITEEGDKDTLDGTITGSSRVSIAASATRALIATGGTLYSTDGLTISQVITPDDIGISSVEYINGYFLASQTDSQRVWFLAPGDVDFDALNFFSAENSADNLVRIRRLGDEAWLFGEASIEVWVPTGDADLPFSRTSGRLYGKGCANRDTVAALDNTLFWVGQDKIVYRADNVPTRISDNGIEERLRKSDGSTYRAWAYSMDGHAFYVLTIGGEGTFAYDVSTQTWVRFKSYERETWRAHIGTQSSGSFIMAGDDVTGDLYTLSAGKSTDAGEPLERELIGGVPVLGKPQRCNNFSVTIASGQILPGDKPKLMLRWSDDGGNTWTSWDYLDLGETGDYQSQYIAWSLGLMRPPGRAFHIRYTHNSVFRVSYARTNEAWAA